MILTTAIFERMAALAEPMRGRLLLVLERNELTVGELCAVFQLPQSSMSRQLKVLTDERWVVSRAEGTSRRYRMMEERLDDAARDLWRVVRGAVEELPSSAQDAERVRSVLAQRRRKSQDFFSTAAAEWDRLRAELYGRRLDLQALLGLLDERWVVGDLGCGTGQLSLTLAPFVSRVIAVDDSLEMLRSARERLAGQEQVEIRPGALEALPIRSAELDAAVIFLVLHYLTDPGEAIREAARVVRPGGRLLIVDMVPHDRVEYRQGMGHLWQGFGEGEIGGWLEDAGFENARWVSLPADPDAKGPSLFAASGRRRGGKGGRRVDR
jgi:ubiquinone/menaquinone biosynthesis C-methylase UbiE